ncbi:DDB1- and CUL4-associated factor 11 like protein [Ditylenchus destructor]|nr:DDB1- and CUL4-associated factor 11 like protein [Ditylenchus destructor]
MGLFESRPTSDQRSSIAQSSSSISIYPQIPHFSTTSPSAFGSWFPSNWWLSNWWPSNWWIGQTQTRELAPSNLSDQLTFAAEIVARQRLAEQLQDRLREVQSDNHESHSEGNRQSERDGPFYTAPSSTSSAGSSSPSLESLPDLSNQSASRDQRNQTTNLRSSDNQRILYFTSLRELLADLLERNELRLSENLRDSISTRNLNMDMSDIEISSDDEAMACSSLSRPRPRRGVRTAITKTFTISEDPVLAKSHYDFITDTRSRCGLSYEQESNVAETSEMCSLEAKIYEALGRRKDPCMDNEPSLVNVIRDRERLGYKTRRYQQPTAAACSRAYTGAWTAGQKVALNNRFLPNKKGIVDAVKAKTFCVGYTDGGLGIMTASQDHKIRLYAAQGKRKRYALRKTLNVPYVGWSILDVAVSPDGRHIVYSTWSEVIYQCNIHDPQENWTPFRVDANAPRFALFSIRFNSDGSEIVGGATDQYLYIYNREVNRCVLALKAHDDDVNAVCFGDQASHIILSAGDDGLCKVWDRRTMGDFADAKPVGIFAGHRDGIVYIDSRGDDRYVLTNCKDQSIKIWDLRHFGTETAVAYTKQACAGQTWDYRWQCSPMDNFTTESLNGDCSVATIRGHSVLHTLIRARFSPDYTGKRYIYTGCGRGNCVVYDLLTNETQNVYSGHASVVRDAVWNPMENEIVTSSWDGKTHVWRWDERQNRCINPDSNVIGDENSCDENYEPIKVRKLKSRPKIRFRGRSSSSVASAPSGQQNVCITVPGTQLQYPITVVRKSAAKKSNDDSSSEDDG